jgi:hypothetical protein
MLLPYITRRQNDQATDVVRSDREYSMKISVILAHPNKGSFNHAIAEVAVAALKQSGHEVYFHDL